MCRVSNADGSADSDTAALVVDEPKPEVLEAPEAVGDSTQTDGQLLSADALQTEERVAEDATQTLAPLPLCAQ